VSAAVASVLPDEVALPIAEELMLRWHDDPVAFVDEVFDLEPIVLDSWQVKVLGLVKTRRRVALKASKGPGKTFLLALAILWFLTTRRFPKIVCTSITGDNLDDGLWAELATLIRRSTLLSALFKHTGDAIVLRGFSADWFVSPRTWEKGTQAQQASTLAGIHADNVMFVLDEVGRIPKAVMAAATAGLANVDKEAGRDGKILIAGNPELTSGPLYDACTRDRELWGVYEISGDPNDPDRAPRVSLEYVHEVAREYGEDSDIYRVNVLGQFPLGQSNGVVADYIVGLARKRVVSPLAVQGHPRVLGVDVARFGKNRSVIFPRQGPVAYKPLVLREMRATELAGRLGHVINTWKPKYCFIDAGGLGGPFVDIMLAMDLDVDCQIVGVEPAGKPWKPGFYNLRAQMWFDMAEWMRTGCIPDDDVLHAELTAPVYKFKSNDKRIVESKDDLEKRGVQSPDEADGLAQTFALPIGLSDDLNVVHTLDEIPMELRRRGVKRPENDWDYNPYLEDRRR
jgi:phage terminase large subunit